MGKFVTGTKQLYIYSMQCRRGGICYRIQENHNGNDGLITLVVSYQARPEPVITQRRKRYLLCLPPVRCILSLVMYRSPGNIRKLSHAGLDCKVNNSTYFLDVRNFGGKSLRDLRGHFLDKRLVFHRLSSLHDPVKALINLTREEIYMMMCSPHNGGLNNVFSIFVNCL